jgi:crotonobetainyl-CoA:carnitine CoA-transferase CaiB-like acyl-CoA transferase
MADIGASGADARWPLAEVRVLELAQLMPGPMLTRRLADLGADVVKVEPPTGDPFRRFPPLVGDRSVQFEAANRGKRSIVLDLRTAEGVSDLHSLLDQVDVVVDGYRAGQLERFGVRWEEVRERRPALTVCSISGFGRTGPMATLPAHGVNIDALAACATVVEVDGEPRLGNDVAWAVELGAATAALATVAALLHARSTGQGAWLDVSCWDVGVEAHRWNLYPALAGDRAHNGLTGRHTPMQSVYRARDGKYVLLLATEEKFWVNFFVGVQRPDLAGQWRMRNYADTHEEPGDELLRMEIAAILATKTATEWNERFLDWDVAGCAVLEEADLLVHPHLDARALVCAGNADMPRIADPVRHVSSGHRPGVGASPAPPLGLGVRPSAIWPAAPPL